MKERESYKANVARCEQVLNLDDRFVRALCSTLAALL